jgi:hypothetical protein
MAKGKGQVCFSSTMGDKGIPKGPLPKVSEKQKGPINFTGQGGSKGIPKKAPGKGKGSSWAGTHD